MLIKQLKQRIARLKDTGDFGFSADLIDDKRTCFWVARNGKVIKRWKAGIPKRIPTGLL